MPEDPANAGLPPSEGADTPQGDPPPSNASEGIPPTEAPKSRFEGKSPEEIIEMYENAQRKLSELSNQNKELRLFATRVLPFFNVEGDTLSLNEEMVRQYAEAKGWLGKSTQEVIEGAMNEGAASGGNESVDDELKRLMEDNPLKAIQTLIRKELQSTLGNVTQPVEELKQQLQSMQHAQIIREAVAKEPGIKDNMAEIGRWIEEHNFNVRSPDDLVRAYKYTLLDKGRFIPKDEAERNIHELERTLAQVSPNALNMMRRGGESRELSNEELLGLKQPSVSNDQKALQALLGKGYIKPP